MKLTIITQKNLCNMSGLGDGTTKNENQTEENVKQGVI